MTVTINGTTGITSPAIDVTTPITVADGGTGLTSVGASGNVLTSNGSAWVSSVPTGGASGGQVFTTSGTFTIPTGVTKIKVTLCGGGGGSGGVSASTCGVGLSGAGGGGATAIKYLTGLTAGNTLTVTVGAAGTAGSAVPGNGGAGGNSTIASGTQTITTVTAGGGSGGSKVNDGNAGATNGGTATNGDINISGGKSVAPNYSYVTTYGVGGASTFSNTPPWGSVAYTATGYGQGAQGAFAGNGSTVGKAGSAGIVVIEW